MDERGLLTYRYDLVHCMQPPSSTFTARPQLQVHPWMHASASGCNLGRSIDRELMSFVAQFVAQYKFQVPTCDDEMAHLGSGC